MVIITCVIIWGRQRPCHFESMSPLIRSFHECFTQSCFPIECLKHVRIELLALFSMLTKFNDMLSSAEQLFM